MFNNIFVIISKCHGYSNHYLIPGGMSCSIVFIKALYKQNIRYSVTKFTSQVVLLCIISVYPPIKLTGHITNTSHMNIINLSLPRIIFCYFITYHNDYHSMVKFQSSLAKTEYILIFCTFSFTCLSILFQISLLLGRYSIHYVCYQN